MRKLVIGLVAALLLGGCSAAGKGTDDSKAKSSARPAQGNAAAGKLPTLQVEITEQTSDGHTIHMSGRVTNQLAETVEGVRLMVAFATLAANGEAQIQEIQRTEIDASLKPGESSAFRWDLESEFAAPGARFAILAFPKRLGGSDVPAPPEWDTPGAPG